MLAVARQVEVGNRILAMLPHRELRRLSDHLESVHLAKGEVYIAGDTVHHAYFPVNGLLSLRSTTEDGSTVEVAMVGNEGVVGILPMIDKNGIAPYDVCVQVPTDAFKIRLDVLQQEFDRGERLQKLILAYMGLLMFQVSQLCICHRFHTIEQALARWLLVARDRLNSDALNLTQESISNAIGVSRTGVTMAACSLQRADLIRYSRGKIEIRDRARLEANTCECYRKIRDEVAQFPRE
jgi:CRP-like cAMP-binding protein